MAHIGPWLDGLEERGHTSGRPPTHHRPARGHPQAMDSDGTRVAGAVDTDIVDVAEARATSPASAAYARIPPSGADAPREASL